jgi:hypothetical protein
LLKHDGITRKFLLYWQDSKGDFYLGFKYLGSVLRVGEVDAHDRSVDIYYTDGTPVGPGHYNAKLSLHKSGTGRIHIKTDKTPTSNDAFGSFDYDKLKNLVGAIHACTIIPGDPITLPTLESPRAPKDHLVDTSLFGGRKFVLHVYLSDLKFNPWTLFSPLKGNLTSVERKLKGIRVIFQFQETPNSESIPWPKEHWITRRIP